MRVAALAGTMAETKGIRKRAERLSHEVKSDHVSIMAAGVAFFAMLGIFPLMTALISTYGLVFDPVEVRDQIARMAGILPAGAEKLLEQQADRVVRGSTSSLSLGLVISVAGLLWSASAGMKALIEGIHVAYGEVDSRSFLKQRLVALGLSIAAVVGIGASLFVIAGLPLLLRALGLGAGATSVVLVVRWVLLAVAVALALSFIYRRALSDRKLGWGQVAPGAALATLLWLIGSLGLSLYTANLANYNEVYGTLSGIIVMLLWLFVSAFAVLIGAELNALRDDSRGHQRAGQRRLGLPQQSPTTA